MKFDRDILTKDQLLLYAVTDSHWLNGRTLHSVVKESLEGGVTFVQLREKQLDEAHFMEEAKDLQVLCREYNVPFIINDNVDIALAMDADGVHVGQSDMEAGDVRAKLGPDKIIGVSAQTVEQAILAEKHGADYLGVGAVFPTGSKDDATEVPHETLKAICEAVSIPVMGNGDVIDAVSCKRMYEETGVDFVMIGRGAQGRPWVFKQIAHYMQTGELLPDPTLEEKMEILLRHIRLSCDYKGEKIGMREARKHAAWYFKGEYGSADFRRRAGQLCTYDDLQRLAEEMLNSRHHA